MVLKTDIHKYIGKDVFEIAKQNKQKIVKFMEVIFVDYYVFFIWYFFQLAAANNSEFRLKEIVQNGGLGRTSWS